MSAVTEYLPVISKLLARTRDRKIEWKGTYDSTIFICVLEGEYSFEIEKGRTSAGNWFYRVRMKDREEGEVFTVRALAPSTSSSTENDQIFLVLEDLFQRARNVALNVDKKLDDVNNLLDKI